MKTIGEIIRSMRHNRGWSQIELAEKAGVGSNTVVVIETGKRQPSDRTCEKLDKAFELLPGTLRTLKYKSLWEQNKPKL